MISARLPLIQVAEEAAGLARKSNARIVYDLSNNSGFAQLVAPLLGRPIACRGAERRTALIILPATEYVLAALPLNSAVGFCPARGSKPIAGPRSVTVHTGP